MQLEEERASLRGPAPREAVHVALAPSGQVVGFQSLDLWMPVLETMAHVGSLGTFVLEAWRGKGMGRQLFAATREFAIRAGYEKLVIQVRASNAGAQAFYLRLGFSPVGRLTRQVRIDADYDDEVLMELFLAR